VEELGFDSSGRCKGVSTTDGMIFCSKKIVVAAGAWTEKLLATHQSFLGHHSYPVATGVCVVHFALYNEELEQFKRNPIFSYHGHGKFLSPRDSTCRLTSIRGPGEVLPPTDEGILKMTLVKSFTNINPDLRISVPFEASGTDVPKVLHEEVQDFMDMVCPALSSRERIIRFYW
jgi:glycine/D-amino acid oxidase-like deaminating enzyme